jgi:3-dehydroquinate synthase
MPRACRNQNGITSAKLPFLAIDFHQPPTCGKKIELLADPVIMPLGGASSWQGRLRKALTDHRGIGQIQEAADGRSILGGERLLLLAVADFHAVSQALSQSSCNARMFRVDIRARFPELLRMPTVHVDLADRSYDVIVEPGILSKASAWMEKAGLGGKRAAVISDETVAGHHATLLMNSLEEGGFQPSLHTVPAGEASKSMFQVESICREMIRGGHDRKSFVVALGGGVVGDLAGFVAAIFYRGIPFVQVPTTIVSQVDSSVGGKTGVNAVEGKNLLGSFHQPQLVLVDPETLRTLPDREYREGFAEAIKHAAIRDASMLDDLAALDPSSREVPADLIARNIAIKARVVEADEHETLGVRALLNFGHTIGHGIEAAVPYGEMLHGEAISLGMRAALFLSERHGGLSSSSSDTIRSLLAHYHLPLVLPEEIATQVIMDKLARDKKFSSGSIRFVLLEKPGHAIVSDAVTHEDLREAIEELRGLP